MFLPRSKLNILGSALALSILFLGAASHARAENHALIMSIGDYVGTDNDLPGIDKDAAMARAIAASMGVAARNIHEYSNSQLTLPGMKQALQKLTGKIQSGDKVFIYYSGHGGQTELENGKCSEGMVSVDGELYYDRELEADLTTLAGKASQIVMLNDSCFSGGAASTSKSLAGAKSKFYRAAKGQRKSDSYTCGAAVNKMVRSLQSASRKTGTQMVYLGAASERELADATEDGSAATVAWHSCLGAGKGDGNRDGLLNGEELKACAQRYLNDTEHNHTITITGNAQLPISFIGLAGASAAAAPVAAVSPGPAPLAGVAPSRTLETIRAGADSRLALELSLASRELSIGRRDRLDFSVQTPTDGYLYLLHIGSDGKTFDVLFPNDVDSNHFVSAGTHRFPRAAWGIEATGPVGTGYLMAYISSTPKNFRGTMGKAGPFASTTANTASASKLAVVATGASEPGGGRYGTSAVVAVREVQ